MVIGRLKNCFSFLGSLDGLSDNTHKHKRTGTCMHTSKYTPTRKSTDTHTLLNTHATRKNIHINTSTHTHIHMQLIYIFTHTHIQTYTHTHTQSINISYNLQYSRNGLVAALIYIICGWENANEALAW